jgi:hypothetical protein
VLSGHEATLIATQQRIVSELGTASDPHDFALRLVVQESGGSGGFLYLYKDKSLQLMAASSADEPPRETERELLQRVQRVEFEATEETAIASSVRTGSAGTAGRLESSQVALASNVEEDEPETQFVASEPPETQAATFQVFVLSTRQHGRSAVVGGVIVRAGAAGIPRIDPGVLGSIARILYERQSSTVM